MKILSTRAVAGITSITNPTSSRTTGEIQVGSNPSTAAFTSPDSTYCVRAIYSGAGETMTLNLLTGVTSASTSHFPGIQQTDRATAVGTVVGAGNASVTVTCSSMGGSPKTIPVAVANGDTPTAWASKVRKALNADAAVSSLFTAEGSGTFITLARKPIRTFALPGGAVHPHYVAQDSTVNVATATGTATGITAAPTSTNTNSGVVTSGVKIFDAGADWEGLPIVSMNPKAVLFANADRDGDGAAGRAFADAPGNNEKYLIPRNGSVMFTGSGRETIILEPSVNIVATAGYIDLSITVAR